jgi:hypothetical protein
MMPGPVAVVATAGNITATQTLTVTAAVVAPPTPATALASISTQVVRMWGLSAGTWTMYDPADTVGSDLTSLTAGGGYFIKVNNACTLTSGGFTYNLVAGWNLIGWR